MDPEISERLAQVKELLTTVRHATMATVNKDGTPHNTPFYFLHDDAYNYVYWGSHQDSLHSQNILRTGQLFVVVYDSHNRLPGLYIQADEGHDVYSTELEMALAIHNKFRAKENKDPLPRSYYEGSSPQRMWSARITNLWISSFIRGIDGNIVKDEKIAISPVDLL